MKSKNPALKFILQFFSWVMIIIGGPTFVICTLCAVFALAGLLEIYSFGERIVYFLVFLLVAMLFFAVLYCGLKLKRHLTGRANAVKPQEKQDNVSPAVQKDAVETAPAPQAANPQASEKPAEAAEPKTKIRTREERIADFSKAVSVQAAWDTFSPEEQKRFSDMVYQYSQDVERGGYAPKEHYAELRGLVFVGSTPVPKEVAQRREEMQKTKDAAEEKLSENKSAESPVQSTPVPDDTLVFFHKLHHQTNETVEERVLLSVFEDMCEITYEKRTRDPNASPSKESINTRKVYRSMTEVAKGNTEQLAKFADRYFTLPYIRKGMCAEQEFRHWATEHNTEFYSIKIMDDGELHECLVSRTDGKEEAITVKYRNAVHTCKVIETTGGLQGYSHAVKLCLNNSFVHLYKSEIPNRNDVIAWVITRIPEKTFQALKSGTCDKYNISAGKPIGSTIGYEPERRQLVFTVLALVAGKNISTYTAKDFTDKPRSVMCLITPQAPEAPKKTTVPNYSPSKEEYAGITKWVNVIGKPGDHGDVVRIGCGNGKWYLEVTDDGYLNRMNAGGFIKLIPKDVVCGRQLDAEKFKKFFYDSCPGCGLLRDFSDPIWYYKPTAGRPADKIEVIRLLSTTEDKDGAAFSFEKKLVKHEVVTAGRRYFVRVTDYECTSGANGRPVYTLTENYYLCYTADEHDIQNSLNKDNWQSFAEKTAAYRYTEGGTGVLF